MARVPRTPLTTEPRALAVAPRPRGRPKVISDERLLDVARQVFLEQGIRATTLEVAQRAGISEGTVFLRFKSKIALFQAAMQFDPEDLLALVERLPARAGKPDLRGTLLEFARDFLDLGRIAMPAMVLSMSNPDALSVSQVAAKSAMHERLLKALSRFFKVEVNAGRLRAASPEVLAQVLLGSLRQYCLCEVFLRGGAGLNCAEYARQVIDLLLSGAAPKASSSGGRVRSRPSQGVTR
jgi:AcrR family transcriptional regulator